MRYERWKKAVIRSLNWDPVKRGLSKPNNQENGKWAAMAPGLFVVVTLAAFVVSGYLR